MPKRISPADSVPLNVVLITLDNHIGVAVDAARAMLASEMPGLTLSMHAATDWAENPSSLQACRDAIASGDIIIVSMIFIEEHVRAISDALQARRLDCDAMVCCMSAGEIMKHTVLGRFRMDGEQKGPLALLKKLRGDSSRGGRDNGRKAGERQMAMLRRLPKLLRFVPGTAQDVRNYFLTLQYRIAASDVNIANMVRLLVRKYARGERTALQSAIRVSDPVEYPQTGIYHPGLAGRVTTSIADLPFNPKARGTVGLLLLRTYILSGDTGHYDGVISSLEERGLNVIPVFCSGLDMRPAIESYLSGGVGRRIDALCSLTGFSLVGGPAYSDASAAAETLEKLDVPYFSAFATEFQSVEAWRGSAQGLTPIESTLMVAIPELDGAIGSMVVGGRAEAGRGSGRACVCSRKLAQCAAGRACMRSDEDRVDLLVRRIEAMIDLRQRRRTDRKIAVTLFNFPPNSGNIGTAAFLSVFESLHATLRRLKDEGYKVDLPESVDVLREMILHGNAAFHGTEANVHHVVTVDDHVRLERHLGDIEKQWGPAPGKVLANGRGIFVLGRQFGNVLVALQPSYGYEGDPMRLLFEGGFAPNHAFAAFYTYLRETFRADAVLHFGTHGALEFMPGKQVGMSGSCWPERLLGALPNFYLYAANNPSEGTIAKRRSAATLISYLTPPVTNAGLYKGLSELKSSLDRYRAAPPEASAERERLLELVRAQAQRLDLGQKAADLATADYVHALAGEIIELEYALIPNGLHVAGQGMALAERTDMLRHAAGAMSDVEGATNLGDHAGTIAARDGRKLADIRNKLLAEDKLRFDRLIAMDRQLEGNLELDGIARALDGRFVPPSPSGDLIRTPELLPTGRNIHGFDPFGIPSAFAVMDGERQAARVLERHMRADGKLPETVAIVLWGTDNLKTGGAPLAQAMALMGARPRLDSYNRVCGATLIPLDELKRPRIDAVMTLSGIFRDLLPIQANMLAEASYLAATADEPPEQNFIRKHALAYCAAHGCDIEAAAYRVFSNAEGVYGSNVNMLIGSSAWSDDQEIADTYSARKSFAISRKGKTSRQSDLLEAMLGEVDMAYQNLESIEVGVTTIEHYFDTLGGLAKAVSKARGGKALPVYISDQTQGEGKVRSLGEQVALETRTRSLNPKWFEGMLKHGYEGVRHIEAQVTNTFGWSATTGDVAPWVYQQLTETFVLDPAMRQRLADLNPAAASRMTSRLIEAHERDFWQPDDETLAALRLAEQELEDRLEGLVREAAE